MSKATYTFAALALLVVSGIASAGPVTLIAHNQRSSSGALSTLKWATCAPTGATNPCISTTNAWTLANAVGSTATWDWNPATGVLTMTGTFQTTSHISSNANGAAVISDKVVDMVIDTANGTTTAASYQCVEGTFLSGVGAHGCANVGTGDDFVYDGSVAYNVGGDANCVNRTVGGDDLDTGNTRGLSSPGSAPPCDPTDGAFNIWTVVTDDTATGGQLVLSNGVALEIAGTNYLTFEAVPDAADDTAEGFQDTPLVIDVLANDSAFVDPVTVTKTDGTNGTVVVNGSGGPQAGVSVTYTPNAGFSGSDTFTYTVLDSNAATDTATVTVNIAALGANDDTATTRLNTPVVINILANDVGFTNPVTVTSPNGTNGTVTVNNSPGDQAAINLTYTPNNGFTGTDTFDYTIADGIAPDGIGTVTVTVTNAVPTAAPGTITITTVGFDPSTRTGTFNAATGNNLGDAPSVVTVTDPATGTLSPIAPGGTTTTYTPDADFFAGTDEFEYTITDDDGETATNTVTVTIADASPTVSGDPSTSGNANTTLNGSGAFTAGNGSVAQHTLAVQAQAANGTCAASVSGNNIAVAYTPAADYAGPDSCVVRLTDGDGDFDDGTYSFTVNAAPGGGGGTGGLLPGGSGAFDPWSLALLAGLPLLGRRRASRRRPAAGNQ